MKKKELNKVRSQIIRCNKCRLSKTRTHAVPGEGPLNAKIMFIGQAPGKEEDRRGRPFVGRAGQFLNKLLEKNKIERKKVFITSCVKCFPPKNRIPKKSELEACWPYLLKQIELINPKIVVLMGNIAQRYKNKKILKNRNVIKTYHPAAGMRFPKIKKQMTADFRKLKQTLSKL